MSGIYNAWKSMSPAEINKAPPVERKEEGHYEEREIKAPEPTYERPFVREEERMDKNKNEREDEKNSSANEEEEKRPFGVFDNVLLTGTQYRSLLEKLPEAQLFIEKLSSYLASNPSKSYPNHYAVILSWYADYMLKNKNNGSNRTYKNKDSIPTPDPTASYDIRRAELRARTQVPTVKKRNRETGLWEEIKHT